MEEEEVITYEKIREIWRKERDSVEIIKLPENFMEKVKKYLKEKKALIEEFEKEDEELALRIRLEFENAKKTLRDIYEKREKKIVELALLYSKGKGNVTEVSNMSEEEKELMDKIVKLLRESREKFFNELNEVKVEKEKDRSKESDSIMPIKIIEFVPEFMWKDEKVYGPYNENEIVSLPKEIAEYLIKSGYAIEINF